MLVADQGDAADVGLAGRSGSGLDARVGRGCDRWLLGGGGRWLLHGHAFEHERNGVHSFYLLAFLALMGQRRHQSLARAGILSPMPAT